MMKVSRAAFVVNCFWGLSDALVHWSARYVFKMGAHNPLSSRQSAVTDSPHNWLMGLAMDLAAMFDMWR